MSPGSRNEVTQDGVRVFCCSSGLLFYLHLSLQILWKTVIAEEIIMNYHTSEKALVVKRVKAFAI